MVSALAHSGTLLDRLVVSASKLPFDSLVDQIVRQKASLLEALQQETARSRSSVVYLLKPSDRKTSIVALSSFGSFICGFYTKMPQRLCGAFKSIRVLEPLSSVMPANTPWLAVAKLRNKVKEAVRAKKEVVTPFHVEDVNAFFREADISQQLLSRGVPNLLKILPLRYQNAERVSSRLLMEYCDEAMLNHFVLTDRPLSLRVALGIELAEAVAGMHANGFCHLDIKMQNIFVVRERGSFHIRLGDFGAVSPVGEVTGLVSSYPSPEVILNVQHKRDTLVCPSLDLWGLGGVLSLLFGTRNTQPPPFFAVPPDLFLRYARALERNTLQNIEPGVALCADCISRLFSMDPNRRPGAALVAEQLRLLRDQLEEKGR